MLKHKRVLTFIMALVMVLSLIPLQVFATDEAVVQESDNGSEDVIITTDGLRVESAANGDIQFTFSDSFQYNVNQAGQYQFGVKENGSILVTNTSSSNLIWSFKFSSRNIEGITADGAPVGSDGITLYPGASVTIGFTLNGTSGLLAIDNFTSEDATAGDVQIKYDSNLGSVTVNGELVASGEMISIPSSGALIVATPKAGASFIGWVNSADHTYNSAASISGFTVSNGQTVVEAAFGGIDGKAWFYAGKNNTYLYDDLEAATAYVANQSNKVVTLAASGTLAKDTYDIASGAKVLIPRSADDKGTYGTEPNKTETKYGSSQTAFRTLKVEGGAVLNFNGTSQLNVNGSVYDNNGSYSGVCTDTYGCIDLGTGAKINMNSGSTLYCYGYIIGDGTVAANDGSTVYEIFQATGWRGGATTTLWKDSKEIKNFVFNDYAVQNIEANLVVYYGANVGVSATVNAGGVSKTVDATYIGKYATNGGSGLVRLEPGAFVERSFTPETGRVKYTLYGKAHIASIDMTIEIWVIFYTETFPLDTSKKILSIPYYWDFVAATGSEVTLHNDYKLLPGATLTVAEGAKAWVKGNLYIYDTDDYVGKGYTSSGNSVPVRYVASTGATADALPKMNSATASGQVTVNGTLQIDGAMYVTENGGTSVDKVVKGNGVVINNSSATAAVSNVLDEFKYENSAIVDYDINVIPVVGQLAGISTESSYNSFSTGNYTGLGDGWWYQNTVDFSGDLSELKAYNGSRIEIGEETATGYSCTGGTLQFTLPFTYSATCTGATMTQAAAPGSAVMAYSVPVDAAGVTISITEGSAAANNATIKYVSKADGSVVSTQACYIPVGTDVSAYFADEFCTTKATTFESGNTLYILVEAKVGGNVYYASLDEAIKNADSSGDVVTLLSDVQVAAPITVSSEQNINIALDGHTITYSSNLLKINGTVNLDLQGGKIINAQGAEVSALIVAPDGTLNLNMNGGTLTWSDYGVEGYSFSATSPAALVHCYSGGTANINIAEGETISVEHPNAVTAYTLHAVINEGTMTINGAGIITSNAYTATTAAYVNSGSDTYNAAPPVVNRGTMRIQGTTVSSTNTNGSKNYAILNYDGGNLTLDGADISCASGYSVYNWGGIIDSIKDSTITGTNGICNYNMAGYSYTATISEIVGATTIEATGGHALSTHPETYVGVIGGEGSSVELIATSNAINGNEGYIKELGDGLTIIAGGYGVYTKGIVEKVSLGGYYKTGNSAFYADTGTEATPYNASIGVPEGYHLSVVSQMRTLRNGKTYGCTYLTTEEQNYPQILAGHLQELPEITCQGPDLWEALTPEFGYFTDTAWSTSQATVYSITIPVQPGDKISASSFGTTQKADGNSSDGIRVTWFDENGILTSWAAGTTYNNNKTNGYITAPEGAIAVCIPVWVGDWEGNEAYLVKDCVYEFLDEDSDGFYTAVCSGCGTEHQGLLEHLQVPKDDYCAGTNLWTTLKPEKYRRTATVWSSDYYSITFPVEAGDKVWATSFQAAGDNDHNSDGIRVTWFHNTGKVTSFDANAVFSEFSGNTDEATGLNYITAPDSAIAICVTMWVNNSNSTVKILNKAHAYESVVTPPGCAQGYTTHTCSICEESYVDSYTEATGEHKFTNYVSNGDATVEADGTKTAVCDYGCGTENTITDEGSSNVYKALQGKVISIMGDSISTMEGYIPTADGFNLEHYARYVQTAKADTSYIVMAPEETWWMQVINAFGAKLGINESWRSTEIGNIFDVEVNSGYEGTKACMASMTRIQNLGSNGTPDLILFYGGTNDITQRNNASPRVRGTFDASMVPAEVDLTTDKWDTVIEAYVTALMRMHYFYPETRIVCMFPTVTSNNSKNVVSTYNAEFKKACDYFIAQGYDIVYLDLLDSGVTTAHLVDGTHPGEEGMDLISAAVQAKLLETCGDMTVGANTVHTVAHNLTNVKASLSYYKGVSNGKSFVETLTGENLEVTVTTGTENPEDITETAVTYNADKSEAYINVTEVTGALTITAEGKSMGQYLAPYLLTLPENIYNTTNLWPLLAHNEKYYKTTVNDTVTAYDAATWSTNGDVRSVTVPVGSGYRIYATSFVESRGIRTTWFFANGTFESWSPTDTHARFIANTDEKSGKHYIAAPEGAIAVNVAMWDDSDANELYILNLPDDPLTLNGLPDHLRELPDPCYNDTNIWAELAKTELDSEYRTATGWSVTGQVKSVTVPVSGGDRIKATSFGETSGGKGIRVTWFLSDGSVSSMEKINVYNEYDAKGWLTAPGNAIAVCVPMWVANESCEFYNLDLPDNPLKAYNLLDHLVDLPDPCYNDTNIWAELTAANKLDEQYYTESGWGELSGAKSITIPVAAGDHITANSFGQTTMVDGVVKSGIRVTWFFADGSKPKSMSPSQVYTEFRGSGYLTAPANAIAVCVPMWEVNSDCEIYNLSLPNRPLSGTEDYNGKVISIMGDSISTFAGYTPVDDGFNLAHRNRYPQSNLSTDVNETWWMQVLTELDAKLGINDSWAGSRVNNTLEENSGDLGPDAAMASLTRIQNLGANGTPDVILVFGGTNDRGSTLGSFDASTAPTVENVDLTSYKWSNFVDAYATMITRMKHYYPDAEIVAMLPYMYNAAALNAEIIKICEHYDIRYTNLMECGIYTKPWLDEANEIRHEDLPDGLHPSAIGFDYITDAVLDVLLNEVEMTAGENVVYPITHELENVDASKHYYKGVSEGAKFEETISFKTAADVKVMMGNDDVTADAYKAETGVITIESVTGAITITASAVKTNSDHVQPLPDPVYRDTNLWAELEPENEYYAENGWTEGLYSITFPVTGGDKIWSTSLCDSSINGGGENDSICITWFKGDEVLKRLSRIEAYEEFKQNHYVTAPEGATAVNVPTWTTSITNEVYNLSLPTIYDGHLIELNRDEICSGTDIWDLLKDKWEDVYLDSTGNWVTMTDLRSITIPVQEGDVIWANVFGTTTKTDGTTKNGIRITWLSETGILETAYISTAQGTLADDGTITVPDGAIAVNLPVWDYQIENDMYILNLEHKWNDATCTAPKTCSVCQATEGEATGHTYGEPEWSWTGDDTDGYTAATVTFTCTVCEDDTKAVTDNDIEAVITEATTEAAGETVYTASVEFNGQTYTDSKTVEIPKLEVTGTTVTGTVKAYNSSNAPEVKLYVGGVEKYTAVVSEPTASGNQYTWTFTFSDVEEGSYDLVVTKAGHLSYTVTGVQVTDQPLDLNTHNNAAISIMSMLCGDINGDGSINPTDINVIYQAGNYYKAVSEAATATADLNGDGSINPTDINIIYQAANYYKGIADCTVAY